MRRSREMKTMVDAFKEFPHLLAPLQIGDVFYRNHMFCEIGRAHV